MLAEQGRVTEIPNGRDRIAAIARDYASQPDNTIIVSPDNRSRQQINEAVRSEMRRNGVLAEDGEVFRTLLHRSDMTGADRKWAARYGEGDVLLYTVGSKSEGIARDGFAIVRSVDSRPTYSPLNCRTGHLSRTTRDDCMESTCFANLNESSLSAIDSSSEPRTKVSAFSNRDLGTVTRINSDGISVKMDGGKERVVTFDPKEFRQFDHGYAVTSHSSQGLTAGRVLANIDTDSSHSLINDRLAYVAVSRASDDVRIYTNKRGNARRKTGDGHLQDFRPANTGTEPRCARCIFHDDGVCHWESLHPETSRD